MSKGRQRKTKKTARTCDECFFRRRGLCALDLGEPCSTFRLDSPEGLVPPVQPALLLREPTGSDVTAGGGLAQPA